ncbi:hypothetical protein K432DRAFT_172067 [Lepidopterella palustris CBS 459.81]|uniref:Uncharacterized protein n=1 Tax=Lepidopterella palustris CBS 459.81 TaxID=1314670 RepID=A0A8E2EH37_9PEZI|nr:hypothetical protein K432DRAFT_172067 [Lepidopterella palustris CBS 459.81]
MSVTSLSATHSGAIILNALYRSADEHALLQKVLFVPSLCVNVFILPRGFSIDMSRRFIINNSNLGGRQVAIVEKLSGTGTPHWQIGTMGGRPSRTFGGTIRLARSRVVDTGYSKYHYGRSHTVCLKADMQAQSRELRHAWMRRIRRTNN